MAQLLFFSLLCVKSGLATYYIFNPGLNLLEFIFLVSIPYWNKTLVKDKFDLIKAFIIIIR